MANAARSSVVAFPVEAIALARGVDSEPFDAQTRSGGDVLHLAELVPVLRERFGVDDGLADGVVLASLKEIMACSSPRDRWRAAFNSTLGHWLALKGSDLNTTLNTLVALLPKPRM